MSYEPSSEFHDAAAYLSSGAGPSNVSNTTKLELYGLFKHLTVSPAPTSSRPRLWDITGQPKWDAWNAAGQKYAGRAAEAEQRYLAIARELGWQEGAGENAATKTAQGPKTKSKDTENIWDDDSPDAHKSKVVSGWGNKVSTVVFENESEREQGTLHSLSIGGDGDVVRTFLHEHPETNVNQLDENGYTALHLACDRGHKTVVELLLGAGADPNVKDEDDFTALELARIAGHDDIVVMLEQS